jgi:uncharacterized membrane-anchored protein
VVRRRPGRFLVLGIAVFGILLVTLSATAQPSGERDRITRELQSLAWQRGPADAKVGNNATIKIQEGQAFLDGPNTRRFLELTQNPPRDDHYTLVGENLRWFAIFSFDSSGFVKDDEKLDAEALLKSLKDSDRPSNDERKRLGMPPIYTDGWHVPPHYDLNTRRLEWGLRLRAEDGDQTVNYTVRILGRRGVMRATLVSNPQGLNADIKDFKTSLASYDFVAGERYSEFVAGDKIAEYGLAALVLGGAAAVATKTGFLKALGKFVVIGVVALGGTILAVVRKFFGRTTTT